MWDALVIAYKARNESEWARGRYDGALTMYLFSTSADRRHIVGMLRAIDERDKPPMDRTCPYCGAKPGFPCVNMRTKDGAPVQAVHGHRESQLIPHGTSSH